jgi:diguanylate cyclase (GGDEF)-like protein
VTISPGLLAAALFTSAVIALTIGIFTWLRKTAPGAIPLALMLATTVIWAAANGFIVISTTPAARLFWFNVMVVGSFLGTPAFLAFALQYTGRDNWLTLRTIALICIIPITSTLLVWTNSQHHLFYKVLDFTTPMPNGGWHVEPGYGFAVYLAYAYPVVFLTIGIIVHAFLRAPKIYRGQTGTILIGTLIPLVGNLIYNIFIGPEAGSVDPTPFLFTIMGMVYAYGLFSYQLFNLMPVARHTLVELMTDGVLVVDAQNRILDINPAARHLLQLPKQSPVGLSLEKISALLFIDVSQYRDAANIQTEVIVPGETPRFFDLRIESLLNRRGTPSGRLIVIRDITSQKQAEAAILQTNERLQVQLAEIEALHTQLREQALRDPLTNLFNRRHLDDSLKREIHQAGRYRRELSILMLEIDSFKTYNDTYGHAAGDEVLRKVAKLIVNSTRAGDIACRYGGDEFILILPDANLEAAELCAERLRDDAEQLVVQYQGQTLPGITFSIGLAVYPQHAASEDLLLRVADEAMYQAKHNGKNKIVIAAQES